MAKTYNGWPNYETWNVMLWLDNDEPSYRAYIDAVRHDRQVRGHSTLLASTAEAIAESILGPKTGDGVPLDSPKIRWGAIAQAMREGAK